MDEKIVFFILKADGKIYVLRAISEYREYQLWKKLEKWLKTKGNRE